MRLICKLWYKEVGKMAKSFKGLRDKMSPEARAQAEKKTQELLKEILFDEEIQNSEERPPPSPSEEFVTFSKPE